MKYKAIVLDLDGTLLTSQNKISPKTFELLIKIQKLGVKVILASGRPLNGMEKVSNELKLADYGGYLISYNGGRIMDMKKREVIFNSYLDQSIIHDLYDQSRIFNTTIMAYDYDDDSIITEDCDSYIALESKINQLPIRKVKDFKSYDINKSVKCIMTSNPKHLKEVEKNLKVIYNNSLSISRSMPFFLECMSSGIDKGSRLQVLLDHLNIKDSDVIACGDGYNDISLIKSVPLGIAMENGCKEIKEIANYITSSNDDDGIAHVIEKFILN